MAVDVRLLNVLRCPHTGGPLRCFGDEPLTVLNQQIVAGAVFTQLGTRVSDALTEALVSADGRWLYRVEAAIPQLIRGEAIPLNPPSN